jgi:colanic acid biosynthesis protein WcaH
LLPNAIFKQVIEHAPLFSIDLVVMNESQQVLLGLRNNPPAQGFWFVPGGRVYKNETLIDAFARITQAELGCSFPYKADHQLGLFDHFYPDSMLDPNISTHYINAPFLIHWSSQDVLPFPKQQHQAYRWLSLPTLIQDASVHQNSKVFISNLQIKLHPLNLNE